MTSTVRLTIMGGVYCTGLPDNLKGQIRNDLTFRNKQYEDAKKYGRWVSSSISPTIAFYQEDKADGGVFFPKGYIRTFLQFLRYHKINFEINDKTINGKDCPANVQFKGELRDYQSKAVDDLMTYPNGLLEAKTGSGKCLGKGTPVLMYDGTIKKVENIQVGDLLMGPDSSPRRVRTLARGREELYRVIPVKGDSYVVNKSHIISLKLSGNIAKDGYAPNSIINMNLTEYFNTSKTFKHCAKGWRTGVDFPEIMNKHNITPYILGVWLGDGGNTHPTGISCPDTEIQVAIKEFASSIGMNIREEFLENKCPIMYITNGRGAYNIFLGELKKLNLPGNKHIPHNFLCGSRNDRLQLLAGLLDTDGHYSNGYYDYISKDEQLVKDICFLARSLGLAAYYAPKWTKLKEWSDFRKYYRLSISGEIDIIPCKIKRKKAHARQQKKDVCKVGIKAIKPIGIGDYYGFELEGNDRLFLLGDFTVTHNTIMALSLIARRNVKTLILVHTKELLYQWQARIREFLGVHSGIIGDSKFEIRPITVGIVKSAKINVKKIQKEFALVIVDETHRVPSTTFTEVLQFMHNKFTIGLTATAFRNDGLDRAINCFVGPTLHRVSADELQDVGAVLKPDVYFVRTNFFTPSIDFIRIASALHKDKERIELIARVAAQDYKFQEKPILVTSNMVKTCEAISEKLSEMKITNRVLHGSVSSADRAHITRQLREGKIAVLIATTSLISEGFDAPNLHSLLLTSPAKFAGRLIQICGRVLRPEKGKTARIYDFVDENIGVLKRQSRERIKVYKEQGWVLK